jgi:hypothetical protein
VKIRLQSSVNLYGCTLIISKINSSPLLDQCQGSLVFITDSVSDSLFCFRVQAWAKLLGDKLWDLGQICGFSELERKSGQHVRYKTKNWKVIQYIRLFSFQFVITWEQVPRMLETKLLNRNFPHVFPISVPNTFREFVNLGHTRSPLWWEPLHSCKFYCCSHLQHDHHLE